jgi:cytoskeletal protein CcmA (bactofilin family)
VFRKAVFDPAQLIDTNIPVNTTLKGELKCDGNLHIGGMVDGSVECTGNVIISERALVKANVRARNVSVMGTVEGSIVADRVEILDGASVLGDVDVVDLLLDEGGLVRGHVIMRKGELAQPEPLPLSEVDEPEESLLPEDPIRPKADLAES